MTTEYRGPGQPDASAPSERGPARLSCVCSTSAWVSARKRGGSSSGRFTDLLRLRRRTPRALVWDWRSAGRWPEGWAAICGWSGRGAKAPCSWSN